MKINGYKIQRQIKKLRDRRSMAASQFSNGLWQFDSVEDGMIHPNDAMATFAGCEYKIARLQVVQARFNLAVEVSIGEFTMTLHEAIKRLGGTGRMEKMWRSAAISTGNAGSKSEQSLVRCKESEYAKRTVSLEECVENSNDVLEFTLNLQEAIQRGNTETIEMEVDAALFD